VARVAALIPDLLLGSRVQGLLAHAGHEVDLLASEPDAWDEVGGIDVLVVDLATDELDGVTLVETLAAGGELRTVRTVGIYSHVDAATRERAQGAGFDLVVPRSRFMREGGALVGRLAGGT
jgi:CheY-like chemotaxis protein